MFYQDFDHADELMCEDITSVWRLNGWMNHSFTQNYIKIIWNLNLSLELKSFAIQKKHNKVSDFLGLILITR